MNTTKISSLFMDDSQANGEMVKRKKYFRMLDCSAEITSHFNDVTSILGDIPIPELEISCVNDMDGAGGWCDYENGIIEVSNGVSRHVVYHEMSHWVYYHGGLSPEMVPVNQLGQHDVIFACINAGFYALIHPKVKDAFNRDNMYNLPPLYMAKIYDTHEEPEPIFRGSYGLLFAERFFKMLTRTPRTSEFVMPNIGDIPVIAYMAKRLALECASSDPLDSFVTPKDIDASIETAMNTYYMNNLALQEFIFP